MSWGWDTRDVGIAPWDDEVPPQCERCGRYTYALSFVEWRSEGEVEIEDVCSVCASKIGEGGAEPSDSSESTEPASVPGSSTPPAPPSRPDTRPT